MPTGTSFGRKRTGGVGAKPPQIKNLKNKFLVYIETIIFYKFFIVLFHAAYAVRTSSKNQKVQFIYWNIINYRIIPIF